MTEPAPVLYVTSFGDVQGSYRHWRRGEHDSRIPDVAFSIQVYEAMAQLGRRLVVLTAHPGATAEEDEFARFIPVAQPGGRFLAYHLREIALARTVARLYRECGCDGLIVQRMVQHMWPFRSAVRSARFSILDQHNSIWPMGTRQDWKARLIGAASAPTLRSFGLVTCVSPEIARQIRQAARGPVHTRVHMPQYARDVIAGLRRDAPVRADPQELLFAGRVEVNKGVFDLLDAYSLLPEPIRRRCRLSFVGDGAATPTLAEAVRQRGLEDRVDLPGQVSGFEVLRRIAAATVLVCPTQSGFSEGLARTPIEAAMLGTPSVVTEVVPAREVLGEAALVVPPQAPARLAEAIRQLLTDEALYRRAAEAGLAATECCFDPVQSLRQCILDLVAPSLSNDMPGERGEKQTT
jgi:glycosyltransferase involved in cell wall biosynthesis